MVAARMRAPFKPNSRAPFHATRHLERQLLAVRLPQLLDWLAAHPVDALVLQETKLTDDKFPRAEIEAAGYQVSFFGQKTYNGVALLSRAAHREVVFNIPVLPTNKLGWWPRR